MMIRISERCRNRFDEIFHTEKAKVLNFFTLLNILTVIIFLTAAGCGGRGTDVVPASGGVSPSAGSTQQSPAQGADNNSNLEAGIKAYHDKDLDGAVKIFDAILTSDPKNAEALSWRGRVCFDRGEFEKARDYYEKALEQDRKPQFYVNLGDAWIALFNWDKALENLNKALEIKKDQPNWFFSRGIVYTHKKMYKEALADFEAAIKLDPTVDGYFEDRGYALLGLGRTGEAMESFRKAAELNPTNFSSYYAMGMAQSDEGEFEEAVGSFNKSIEVYKKQKLGYLDRNPKLRDLLYAKIFYERGNVYEQMGKLKEAKADMEEALKYAKDSYIIDQNFGFAVHANYGAVLKKTGDKAGSLGYYKKALCFTLNKTSSDDWAEWGKACLETGRDKEALEALGKAVNMGEPLPETHYYYGKALMKNGRKKEAAAEFMKFLSMDEGDERLKEECRKGLEGK